MFLEFDLWADGAWRTAARFEAIGDPTPGRAGKAALEYDTDYAAAQLGKGGSRALSCRYLPSFELWVGAPWPAFVLDILPAGAARRAMVRRLGLSDTNTSDWALLARSHSPPGNVRVHPVEGGELRPHAGFDRRELLARGEDFIEYAFEHGAPVAGSTGAQGEAPKFLLCTDSEGRWHAEGALPEEAVAGRFLVKFPRGRHSSDLLILEEEARYMELAQWAGLRANVGLVHEAGCLFVPRFDRPPGEHLGLETVASLSGLSEYGMTQTLQESAAAIAQHCSSPGVELAEFLRRDVFNLAVGNTDNHVRNTSVLKWPDGRVELSPLYDVAPMILDREGIPRACRWGRREASGGIVDWAGVVADLARLGAEPQDLRRGLGEMADKVAELGAEMKRVGVHVELRERLALRHKSLAQALVRAVSP